MMNFEQAADVPGHWYVVHTRSRQEKALAADLAAMGVAHYLPLTEQVRYHGRRKRQAVLPLFPGYLFLRGGLDEAYEADRTRRVARILPVPDQAMLDRELRSVDSVLRHGDGLLPHPYLQRGVWVEVRSGPLRGVQGLIEDLRSRGRLILRIQALGQASSLEIDGSLLEPISGVPGGMSRAVA